MDQRKIALILSCLLLTMMSSCYRMPEEGEYSVVPSTNNPDVTRERGNTSMMPGAGF